MHPEKPSREKPSIEEALADLQQHLSRPLQPCAPLCAEDEEQIRWLVRKQLPQAEAREIIRKTMTYEPWRQAFVRISREECDPRTLDDAVDGGEYEGGYRRLDVRKLMEDGKTPPAESE